MKHSRSRGDGPFDWGLRPDATQNACQSAEKGQRERDQHPTTSQE